MSEIATALVLVLGLSALAMYAACRASAAQASLSRKERRYLAALCRDFGTDVPLDDFYTIALALWNRQRVDPMNLTRWTRFAEDVGLHPPELQNLIEDIGRDLGSEAVEQNADRIATLADLVRYRGAECIEAVSAARADDARRRCPNCGFVYAFDGITCQRCGRKDPGDCGAIHDQKS
jgi:hypothetical protein